MQPAFDKTFTDVIALAQSGRRAEATALAEAAVMKGDGDAASRHRLGKYLYTQQRFTTALTAVISAIDSAPGDLRYARTLHGMIAAVYVKTYDPICLRALQVCFDRPELSVSALASNFVSLYRRHPSFVPVWNALSADTDSLDVARFAPALCDRYFLHGVSHCLLPDLELEAFLTRLRRFFLLGLQPDFSSSSIAPVRNFLYALAQQCFLNEYAYAPDSREVAAIAHLSAAIETADEARLRGMTDAIALLACYAPIRCLANAATIAAQCHAVGDPGLSAVIRRQIDEPAREEELMRTIPVTGVIEDAVSRAVRAQYESNPYPRWVANGTPEATSLRDRFALALPTWPGIADAFPERPAILVAGCGTGQHPIEVAQQHPGADVLAVDLSRASLAYALRKAEDMGVANLRFMQADILALGQLSARFDVIECSGVLHHMAEPSQGLNVLAGLLKPGGLMKIGLYSERARTNIVAARRAIAAKGFRADAEGIRAFRAWVARLPEEHHVKLVTRFRDFYSLSECRDLVFHVQEHRFTPLQISGLLADAGLEFLGFDSLSPFVIAAYMVDFPGDPARADLANWDAFETARPDTFSAMCQFWVRQRASGRFARA